MGEFFVSGKTSESYLDQASNGNGSEKAILTMRSMDLLRRQGAEGMHVIEVGPGGGAAVNAIAEAMRSGELESVDNMRMSFVELDGVASTTLQNAQDNFSEFGESRMYAGDAKRLDETFPEGADVVAMSAVLHEVYSYAGGYAGVDETIKAVTNTVRPGGYFAYRDVFSVDRPTQHERKKHIYDTESWVRFSKLFLPYYLSNAEHPYHREDDQVMFEQNAKPVSAEMIDPKTNLTISAPIGVLRELQRHYITLRDHAWRADTFGVVPDLEGPTANDWLNKKHGHKRVHYTSQIDDPLLMSMSERDSSGKFVVDGDVFDATTEILLGEFLQEVADGNEGSVGVWEEWLKREGSETYVYMTVDRLIANVALRSLDASEGSKILLPARDEDVFTVPRAYYNRFLQGQLSNPLYDGKQFSLFKAIDTKEQPDEVASALEVVQEKCAREVLAKIYPPIRQVVKARSRNV